MDLHIFDDFCRKYFSNVEFRNTEHNVNMIGGAQHYRLAGRQWVNAELSLDNIHQLVYLEEFSEEMKVERRILQC